MPKMKAEKSEKRGEGSDLQAGSGVTTLRLMRDLENRLAESFESALIAMRTKKRDVAALSSAFRDGMRTMLQHLGRMGVVRALTEEEVEMIRKVELENLKEPS